MEEFINLLKIIKPTVDFENCTTLLDDGIIDSIDIVEIISEIYDKYNILIPSSEIIPENFNSAEAIKGLIDSLSN